MASDDIQRVLFVCNKVHIYTVPPLSSNTGYKAAEWNVDQEKARIFTARVRIVETATLVAGDEDNEKVRTDVRLDDPKTGDLFANCPYEGAHCVEQVTDSSRFFAVRVVDSGRKAMLGIGFEERSEAFDFGVSLQEVRRHNDFELNGAAGQNKKGGAKKAAELAPMEARKDYSLKEGETINITIGVVDQTPPKENIKRKVDYVQNKGRRRAPSSPPVDTAGNTGFPLPFLPPPPSAEDVKRRQSQHGMEDFGKLGFDDDAFGDFV